MSNLYELLEVSEKASKEIIERAYKILAKRYHPDLQEEKDKKQAEEKMKQINEAYTILIDDEKRKAYDIELNAKRQEEIQRKMQENTKVNNEITRVEQEVFNDLQNANIKKQKEEQDKINRKLAEEQKSNMEKLQADLQRTYSNAYNNYLRSLGYKIKEPWTLKRFIELMKVLIILAVIIIFIWFFPPTHKLIIDFYEQNVVLKFIIDIFIKLILGLWNAIVALFSNIK